MNTLSIATQKRQEGTALLVSIVLIFMLSVLGIGAMRDATLEGQLAANALQKEVTFQSAESATDVIIEISDASDANAIEMVICQDESVINLPDFSVADVQETTVSTKYTGLSLPPGWSIGGPVSGRRFEVTGESTLADANTSTKITQGVIAVGANQQGGAC